MPTANNEKLTGPHSGRLGLTFVLLLTLATWSFLYFLHVKLWHDPMNPMSPDEGSTVIQSVPTTPATATVTKPTTH